ncbi:MAG: addiction module protein [Acidobacteria bacterium]|nr:addiction module protein [Acidobacteriota bacterium]
MDIEYGDITNAALSLPIDARAILADKLVSSLDESSEKTVDEIWAVEALRRLDEIRSRKVETIDGDEVFDRVRKAIRK